MIQKNMMTGDGLDKNEAKVEVAASKFNPTGKNESEQNPTFPVFGKEKMEKLLGDVINCMKK